MKRVLAFVGVAWIGAIASAATSVTKNALTWTFDREAVVGRFATGDWWVKGPVKIVAITESYDHAGFDAKEGQDGSMVNPKSVKAAGYDSLATRYYDAKLNAARPNGQPLSRENPLELKPGQSLVSTVSWRWRSPTELEPGCPRFAAHIGTPVTATHAAEILTCVSEIPPDDAFRPAYCGDAKKTYRAKDIRWSLLRTLEPPKEFFFRDEPTAGARFRGVLYGKVNVRQLVEATERPWIDHLSAWPGSIFAASDNKPPYGRDAASVLTQAMLALHCDWTRIPGDPPESLRRRLALNLIQIGIDLKGAADIGVDWGADGGIGLGRRPAILFAGLLLGADEITSVASWKNRFQETEGTFYVTEREIALSHSAEWKPDRRCGHLVPYAEEMLGMPEWGIRHVEVPLSDNASWSACYREINNTAIPGFALALMLTDGGRRLFAHEAYFDYADRIMRAERNYLGYANNPPAATISMWRLHRALVPSTYDPKYDRFILLK